MCTNLTVTTEPTVLQSESEQCKAAANPNVCKRDAIVMKFDRWGSFWWGLPIQQGYATKETEFWTGRAREYLISTETEVADLLFANNTA